MIAARGAVIPFLVAAFSPACSSGSSPATLSDDAATDARMGSGPGGSGLDGSDTDGNAGEAEPSSGATRPSLRTVFLIVMENKNLIQLRGNPDAPFVNSLFTTAASAEQYYNPPLNHPSEPNYVWMEAGDSLGIPDDNDPAINSRDTSDHLSDYLDRAGISWKAYEEDISGMDCPLVPVNLYGPKHNPFVFFDDVTGHVNATDPYCIRHIRPFAEFANDLTDYTVARYNFITPNLCNDMHSCATPVGDTWLKNTVTSILASSAYAEGGVIFITWDEADGGDGPIGMFVLSQTAKAGYSSSLHYDHSSLLKTMQEIFGVGPLLRHAGDPSVNDLSDLFSTFP